MIFRKYYAFILYWLHYKGRRQVKREFIRNEPIWGVIQYPEYAEKEIVGYKAIYQTELVSHKKWYDFLFYPLGGCPYCNGTWIYIITFFAFYLPFSFTDFVLLLLGCGVNYLFILLIDKVK